jgi:hypothetical protein
MSKDSSPIHNYQNAMEERQEVSLNKTPQLTNKELIVNVSSTSPDACVTYTIPVICFRDNGF